VPRINERVISAETAKQLRIMMESVVSGQGTAPSAAIPGYRVAGKTGTAQNGEDQPYTLWFTGFAPADNPQVAVAVVIADGGGQGQGGFGNSLAAPVARKVIEAVLRK
jgi:peptidoglycan glycosyltransferase